ncbi:MAG: helicase [Polyangiaceae bacterium]|nr:helicase [Polyangiaceae bacterium]
MATDAPVTALLGPTNTGKTHRAVERRLEHESGMLGLPLRLLAREVYDKVSARVGERRVALVTGEEKRVPASPAYWISTVEAMPMDRRVDFVAVDEIQLAAHRERGHVFTDRLLHARGRVETWFLGAETVRSLLSEHLPGAELRRHPRLSRLRHAGSATLGQLPPRSAVVAFSMARVYEIAERLRRRRGGAAVVLGALSPRARNAQVAMFESGEVDHMVATDAIGMGLNLDLCHVAFADLEKFDGKRLRPLEPAELAQIAGRAGRHQNDGTFGTLAPLLPLSDHLARCIETHRFAPERRLIWRSRALDTSSIAALIASLERGPQKSSLRRVEQADDFSALLALSRDPEVVARATDPERVDLLWETCQIPDYRQLMPEAHARLVREVFLELCERGRLGPDRLAKHIRRVDDPSGDIETLLARMAGIRTWTYVASHSRWVDDPGHFQAVTRGVEDRLSDALHARLIERFVERSRPKKRAGVPVDGPWARAFERDEAFARLLVQARGSAPAESDEAWVAGLIDAPHERFSVDAQGSVRADGRELGRLTAGADLVSPEVRVTLEGDVSTGARVRLTRRLVAFSRDLVAELFAPLRSARAAELSPAGRGLVYQLERALGTLPSGRATEQLAALTGNDLRILAEIGVVIGQRAIYSTSALAPRALEHRAALWNARAEVPITVPQSPSFPIGRLTPIEVQALWAVGFVPSGPRAERVDRLEAPRRRRRRRRKKRPREAVPLPGVADGPLPRA